MKKLIPVPVLLLLSISIFTLSNYSVANAGGFNLETLANNNLLNTFRDLDANQPSLLIQDGVVDFVDGGDPFVTTPPTFGSDFLLNCPNPSESSIQNNRPADNLFDGTDATFFQSARRGFIGGVAGAIDEWAQCDLGSGNTKTPGLLRIFFHSGLLKDFILQGSNDGTNFTDIFTGSLLINDNGFEEFTISNQSTAYRYFRLQANSNFATDINAVTTEASFKVMELKEQTSPGGISPVTSIAVTAERQPETCHVVVFEEDIDTVNLNTDLKAFCSRDNGTTWTEVVLADEGDYESGKRILSGTGRFDDDDPAGTSMSYKLEKTNKDFNVHGIGFEWD